MTIKEFFEKVQNLPDDTIIIAFDADSGQREELTGFVFDPEARTLSIYTDDIS